ncbi:MAPEG family protein [Luteimonas salinilitoris]|uniref:MAPEG family protein n=1 Tax=Luteimonas salinilitoris TaxID=3237697 RepID=A0ABV4HQE1_9GAMM
MNVQSILLPGLAMVALTFVVMTVMYRRRVAQMRRERIRPQAVATSTQAAAKLTDCSAADNFRNLFELPVLFYFALVVAALTAQVTPMVLGLAWAFVALRIAHSVIQCGYNTVMHRFWVFLLGAVVLLLLWLRLAWGLLAA